MECAISPVPFIRVEKLESFILPFRTSIIRFIILSALSGNSRFNQSTKSSFTEYGNRSIVYPPHFAPRIDASRSIDGSSSSFKPGMTGAAFTLTGIRAFANSSIACNLCSGVEVLGSMRRAKSRSSVVIDKQTDTRLSEAN